MKLFHNNGSTLTSILFVLNRILLLELLPIVSIIADYGNIGQHQRRWQRLATSFPLTKLKCDWNFVHIFHQPREYLHRQLGYHLQGTIIPSSISTTGTAAATAAALSFDSTDILFQRMVGSKYFISSPISSLSPYLSSPSSPSLALKRAAFVTLRNHIRPHTQQHIQPHIQPHIQKQSFQRYLQGPIFYPQARKVTRRKSHSQTQSIDDSHHMQKRQQSEAAPPEAPLVIVLAGPTAVGKSDVAAELCSPSTAFNILHAHDNPINNKDNNDNTNNGTSHSSKISRRGHVISADSVQAYKGVEIGANKPTLEEIERTPHHLINVVNPPQSSSASSYNAADWMRDARYVIQKLTHFHSSNHVNEDDDGDNNHNNHNKHVDNDSNNASRLNPPNNDDPNIDNDGDMTRIRRRNIDDVLNQHLGILPSLPPKIKSQPTAPTHDSPLDETLDTAQDVAPTRLLMQQPTLPVVVGGTMMYLQWLVHGRPDAVRPTKEAMMRASEVIYNFRNDVQLDMEEEEEKNVTEEEGKVSLETESKVNKDHKKSMKENCSEPDVKKNIEELKDEAAWKAASNYVASLGPVFQERVKKLCGRDWYRLRRLLEVAYTIASQKMTLANNHTNILTTSKETESNILNHLTEEEIYTGIRSGSLLDCGYDVRCFFLCPNDRMQHFETVDVRCEQMLLRGLLRETTRLYLRDCLPPKSQLGRAIGYRQSLNYLLRNDPTWGDAMMLSKFIDDFATATRQYAKKQMQWFRKDLEFVFVPVGMGLEKEIRAKETAKLIVDLCKLSRDDFLLELSSLSSSSSSSSSSKTTSKETKLQQPQPQQTLSMRTKIENERQGKKMKLFASKRQILIQGSQEFHDLLLEADECTKLIQGLVVDKECDSKMS